MIYKVKSGHPGGSLSAAEIVSVLYFDILRIDPCNPRWEDRDRFILSKGHADPVLYAALAERGFFPVEELDTLRDYGSRLQGHPCMRKTPGIDMSTGSLGQGLSAAVGMALAARLDQKDYRIYVLLGDGETQEGQVWEAAMAASHYKLGSIIALIDRNGLGFDGPTESVMALEPLAAKWSSFGWQVFEVNGHKVGEILSAIQDARKNLGQPSVIIAHTVKGKGVSYMENQVGWHGGTPTEEQYNKAMEELCLQ